MLGIYGLHQQKVLPMKRTIGVVIKIIAIAVLLIGIAFLIKDSSHYLKNGVYSASAPTQVKFDTMKRWIPQDAELVLVVDPHRLFASDAGTEQIAQWLEKGVSFAGLSLQLIAHLIINPGAVGLVATAIEIAPTAKPAEGFIVIQGLFDQEAMAEGIQEQMMGEGVVLSRGECEGHAFYVESSSPDAFAIAFPDKHHLLVGTNEALERIMHCEAPTHGAMPQAIDWYPQVKEQPLFGRLAITPRLSALLPEELQGIASVRLAMGPDFVLHATVPCTSSAQAERASLFLEGMRASLILASANNPELSSFLLGIQMITSPNALRVAVPLKTVKSEM